MTGEAALDGVSVDIQDRVLRVVRGLLRRQPGELSLASRLVVDLGMDSLDGIEFLMDLEEEFGCRIDDGEAEKCLTLGECVDLVGRSLAAASGAGHALRQHEGGER